jgi:hypothetical protein
MYSTIKFSDCFPTEFTTKATFNIVTAIPTTVSCERTLCVFIEAAHGYLMM